MWELHKKEVNHMTYKDWKDFEQNADWDDFLKLEKVFKDNELTYKNDAGARVFFEGFVMPLDEAQRMLVSRGYIKSEKKKEWTPPSEQTPLDSEDLKDFRMNSDDDFDELGMDRERDYQGEDLEDEELNEILGIEEDEDEKEEEEELEELEEFYELDDDGDSVKGDKKKKPEKKAVISSDQDWENDPYKYEKEKLAEDEERDRLKRASEGMQSEVPTAEAATADNYGETNFGSAHEIQGQNQDEWTEAQQEKREHAIQAEIDVKAHDNSALAEIEWDETPASESPSVEIQPGMTGVAAGILGSVAEAFGAANPEPVEKGYEPAIKTEFVELSQDENPQVQQSRSMEEVLNETIGQMQQDLEPLHQYDEHAQVMSTAEQVQNDKYMSDDPNATNAFNGQGVAGDASTFGQAFNLYANQMGDDTASSARTEGNIADMLNSLVMGMAFTGSGEQIREAAPEPVVSQSPQIDHFSGVKGTVDGGQFGVESGFVLDDYGNLKSVGQINAEAEKKSSYEIGQDTRDIQQILDVAVADKDARDAVRVQSYGGETVVMPSSTMMQGEDFNSLYMQNFADATAVEFSAQPIPENIRTVDFSVAKDGSVLGYEQFGVVYITAAPPTDHSANSTPTVTMPQVYLNPDSAGMFKDCHSLKSVNFGDGVADTSFVHNMGGMFINCEKLVEVDANGLNTGKLQNIDGMFANCTSLESVQTKGWNTSNVATASFAFSECSSLKTDPSASWRMDNLRNADGFMSGCSNLQSIDMSNWNARSLETTREMFNGCASAETININGLQTTNVKDMSAMFKGCENLEDVNLSKLNTSSLAPITEENSQGNIKHPIDDMFYGCSKLANNEAFKSEEASWEATANRATQLNAPVFVPSRTAPDTFEGIAIPVETTVRNKDGSVSQVTSFYGTDGSQTFVIPATPGVAAPCMAVAALMEEKAIVGAQAPIDSKAYQHTTEPGIPQGTAGPQKYDVETGVKNTEIPLASADVQKQQMASGDKAVDIVSTSPADAKLQQVKADIKGGDTSTPSTKAPQVEADTKNVNASNETKNAQVLTGANVLQNEIGVKHDNISNSSADAKLHQVLVDAKGQQVESGIKTEQTLTGSKPNQVQTETQRVQNPDGTTTVITSKTYADNSKITKEEVVAANGEVVKTSTSVYDKNGSQIKNPEKTLENLALAGAIIVATKANNDGSVSITTSKVYADASKIVQTQTISKNGEVVKDIVAHDKDGKLMTSIPQDKIADISVVNSLKIDKKSDGQEVSFALAHNSSNSKTTTTINMKNDGTVSSKTVLHGKDGNSTTATPPVAINRGVGQPPVHVGINRVSPPTISDSKNDARRSRKDNGGKGNPFGTSASTSARTIYTSARFDKDKILYNTGKKIEKIGKGSEGLYNITTSAIRKLTETPVSEIDMESKRITNKSKNVAKNVVKGIFGVSIAAALHTERIEFNKTAKAAQVTGDLIERKGLSIDALRGKSQKEVIKNLSELKDSHGKQLLTEKQIKNIAKHREGAADMLTFKNAIDTKMKLGQFAVLNRTRDQSKSLDKFSRVGSRNLTKLKPKDVANLADLYFASARGSVLFNKKVSQFSKKDITDILRGKNPNIKISDLSKTDIAMLRAVSRAPKKAINLKTASKKILSASFSAMLKLAEKAGDGIADASGKLIGDVARKAGIVTSGAKTAIGIASIYGKMASGLVRGTGRLLLKTPPGKIIVKAGQKVSTAIGNTAPMRKVREVKKNIQNKRATKAMKKLQKKEHRKSVLKKGAKKIADSAKRTRIGKAAAKAHGKAIQIANSKAGKIAGKALSLVAAPFKGLAAFNKALASFANAVKGAFQKLALYAAAGLLACFAIYIVVLMLMSAMLAVGGSSVTFNSSIMAPPSVDQEGNPIELTEEESAERWKEFKELIQEKYNDGEAQQAAVKGSATALFSQTPNINGRAIIGWAGKRITEYGVAADMAENKGIWISYQPYADDNAKDAIVLAYIIMGPVDFYFDETARDALIADLIASMNPGLGADAVTNTVYPDSTFADETKKIYACKLGCETLTYYCVDDKNAHKNFSKSGCTGKSALYSGDVSAKDLVTCVRLTESGDSIIANGDSIPDKNHPVIYTNKLVRNTYGDSCVVTCSGAESVTINYSYSSTKWCFLADGYATGGMTTTEIARWYGYGSATWNSKEKVWYIYDKQGKFVQTVAPWYWGAQKTTVSNASISTTLKALGKTHGSKTSNGAGYGINYPRDVLVPSASISISQQELANYVERRTNRSVISAWLSSSPSETCGAWTVEFVCNGHTINTCPNGHTDLGVCISQYSLEDFNCWGDSGGSRPLPSNTAYNSYVNKFLSENPSGVTLEVAKNFIDQDWPTIYGIETQQLTTIESGSISEAYIYHYLTSQDGLGLSKAQAAAFLGYMKAASDFQIDKSANGYFGLCQWGDYELDRIGKDAEEEQPTLLEQLALLRTEFEDVTLNSGFAGADDLVSFRECIDTPEGAGRAAEILATRWSCGHVGNVQAAKTAAISYFNQMQDASTDFCNPRLEIISSYVTWALKTASSPEHGYCQGKFQSGAIGDFACGSFVHYSVLEGTKGTDYPVPGWPSSKFMSLSFPDGVTEEDLKFGDLIFRPAVGERSEHIEIYIGNGCSVGARGNDGPVSCSAARIKEKHPSVWEDHVFHQSGDQGSGWVEGAAYTYTEISASETSDLDSYKVVYRLR